MRRKNIMNLIRAYKLATACNPEAAAPGLSEYDFQRRFLRGFGPLFLFFNILNVSRARTSAAPGILNNYNVA